LLIIIGNRSFGISQNLEHLVAITQPSRCRISFFKYDWRPSLWSLVFTLGVIIGGLLAGLVFKNPEPVQLSQAAIALFSSWGLAPSLSLNPPELFSLSYENITLLIISGVLIGFGTRYAYGCTSGHAITGLATFQYQSLIAVIGIFSGGLFASHILVPALWR
jgi:uncharacterized membrane protein YedE/YeeE